MKSILLLISLIVIKSYAATPNLPKHNAGTCTSDGKVCAFFAPQDMPVEAVRAYMKMATKSIRIATYNFSIADYADLLNAKAREGVKIEYMVDHKLSFKNKIWPKLNNHKNLNKYRLPVMRGRSPQMHNKLIVIDGKTLLTGSANYTSFGLISNYENVMAISDLKTVNKFQAEMDEMKAAAIAVCEIFSNGNCNNGGNGYDVKFNNLLTTGSFAVAEINMSANNGKCKWLTKGGGLLTKKNNLFNIAVLDCFKDDSLKSKISKLATKMNSIERYANGQLTSSTNSPLDNQSSDKYKVYFSPEDNLEAKIITELKKTLKDPENSFAYISTNFITNKKLVATIQELNAAGVRLRVFFDRGRFTDKNFRYQLPSLSSLGFFGDNIIVSPRLSELGINNRYSDASDYRNLITIFHNDISGPYACNHNKMAVIGVGNKISLVNGSANWSAGAMARNGENIVITEDKELSLIYLREILSQLFVYRYAQQMNGPAFQDELNYFGKKYQCFNAVMGRAQTCKSNHKTWNPNKLSTAVISLKNVPTGDHDVWAYVPQLNNNQGSFVKLYENKNYNGYRLGAISAPLNWKVDFKFFLFPKDATPTSLGQISGGAWEKGGYRMRSLTVKDKAVHLINGKYSWGQF